MRTARSSPRRCALPPRTSASRLSVRFERSAPASLLAGALCVFGQRARARGRRRTRASEWGCMCGRCGRAPFRGPPADNRHSPRHALPTCAKRSHQIGTYPTKFARPPPAARSQARPHSGPRSSAPGDARHVPSLCERKCRAKPAPGGSATNPSSWPPWRSSSVDTRSMRPSLRDGLTTPVPSPNAERPAAQSAAGRPHLPKADGPRVRRSRARTEARSRHRPRSRHPRTRGCRYQPAQDGPSGCSP